MRASLGVDFTAIKMQCRELNLAVPRKASSVFRVALRGIDASQEPAEAGQRVTSMEASAAEQLADIVAL